MGLGGLGGCFLAGALLLKLDHVLVRLLQARPLRLLEAGVELGKERRDAGLALG